MSSFVEHTILRPDLLREVFLDKTFVEEVMALGISKDAIHDKPLFHQTASRPQEQRERRPVDSRVHDELCVIHGFRELQERDRQNALQSLAGNIFAALLAARYAT